MAKRTEVVSVGRAYQKMLEDVLLKTGSLTPRELEELRELQETALEGTSLDHILVTSGKFEEGQLLHLLGQAFSCPTIRISEHLINEEVVRVLPKQISQRHTVFPVARENGELTVAMTEPSNVLVIDELRHITKMKIRPILALEADIDRAIARYYGGELSEEDKRRAEERERGSREEAVQISRLKQLVEDAPAVNIVNSIIESAINERSSDIHIEINEKELVIRYRIDGVLYDYMKPDRHLHSPLISRIKVMAQMNIAERRLPQDGRIPVKADNKEFDIRVSTIPATFGEKAVLRLLPKSEKPMQLEELGLTPGDRAILEDLIQKPYGMYLVTGPTGSGKTTTLYAALNRIDCVGKNVVTLEDPVEYQMPRVTQIQVHPKIGLTFAAGLRSILRQDPDVIMVGEIRDPETLEMAIQAALTGHLVFSTLHCNDAAGAAPRCLDMGAEPFLVASSLIGVQAQRLVRRICTNCREPYQPSPLLLQQFGMDPSTRATFYRGTGCGHCRHTGYYGRISVFEIVKSTEKIKEAILARQATSHLRRVALEEGAKLMTHDGLEKVLQGITTIEEVMRAVYVEN